MNLKSHKAEFIAAIGILLFSVLFIYLFQVFAPFVLALIMAFVSFPAIKFIQKGLKNQALSTVVFLLGMISIIVVFMVLMGNFISRDFSRFNQGLTKLAIENQDDIDAISAKAYDWLNSVYDFSSFDLNSESQVDSLVNSVKSGENEKIDIEAIKEAFASVLAFFSSESSTSQNSESNHINWIAIIFESLTYYALILFNINYFVAIKKKYFGSKVKGRISLVFSDFNNSFIRYFKLRANIVFILLVLYFIAFALMDLPGISIFLILILVLSFIPYLQYLVLLPIALSCFILSIETDQSFLFYMLINIGAFVLASLIEEIILIPKIMEAKMGMNPAIMVLSVSIGSYLFGVPGLFLGVPLASLLIIYVKRYFVESWLQVSN